MTKNTIHVFWKLGDNATDW